MATPLAVARLRVRNSQGFFDSFNVRGVQARIKATVSRSLRTEPNTATIDIYNLSEDTIAKLTGVVTKRIDWSPAERAALLAKGASAAPIEITSEEYGLGAIELSWGFMESDETDMLSAVKIGFVGQSNKIHAVWEGTDQILRIQAEDGAHLLGAAEVMQEAGSGVIPFVGKSYRNGTEVADIIADMVNACGLTVDKAVVQQQIQAALIARNLPASNTRILGSYNASGPARPQIEAFLTALQLRWSIQNGELLILNSDSVIPGFAPIQLSRDAGNIFGVPEVIEANRLAVTSWADADFQPGRQVDVVTSPNVRSYRIEQAVTEIDTYSGGQTRLELDELQTIPGVF